MVECSGLRRSQPGAPVAFLEIRSAANEYEEKGSDLSTRIPILANRELHLGRNSPGLSCVHQTISKRHLTFRCVLFDNDGQWGIQPLVYADDNSTNGTLLKRAPSPDMIMMRPPFRTTLLEDEDELWLSPFKFIRFCVQPEYRGKSRAFTPEMKMDMKMISRRYHVKPRIIGEGGYGAVHVAIHLKTQCQLACKIISLDLVHHQARHRDRLAREFDVLKDLDHPNIIALEKVYHSDTGFYIFQELITGGDLFSLITNRYESGVPAVEAGVIVYQILKGIRYLHENGIVHRDIKPDNILLTSTNPASRVVITDFGQARYLPDEDAAQRMKTVAGTLGFNAPEIYRRNPKAPCTSGYSKAVDVWSVGCVAAQLLTGKPVFHANSAENQEAAVKELSIRCDLDFLDDSPAWKKVGHRAKDFIRRTVVLDENYRLSANEALRHDWFSNRAHADEFEAVYQHLIRGWEPRRRTFKVIERIPTSRPQMELNKSQFFPPTSLPDRRPLPVADLLSGQSPVMPVINEEAAFQNASWARPSSPVESHKEELSGSPAPWESATPEDPMLTKRNASICSSQLTSTTATGQPDTGGIEQHSPDAIQNLHQEAERNERSASTEILTQNSMQEDQVTRESYCAHSAKQVLHPRSYISDSAQSQELYMGEDMRRLSLVDHPEGGGESMDLQGPRQPSFDFDEEAAQALSPRQPSFDFDREITQNESPRRQSRATATRESQPSSDFDQGPTDVGFWEVALTSEFCQPAAKKLRTH